MKDNEQDRDSSQVPQDPDRRRVLAGLAASGVAIGTAGQAVARGFGASALPAPHDSGIDHVVVVMMENRSFDHILGWVPGAEGIQAGLTFRDTTGAAYATHDLAPDYQNCSSADPSHSYEGGRIQYNDGKCNGWLRSGRNDSLSIGYYHETPEDKLFDISLYSVLHELTRRGVVVVCSAGNDATARENYPAAFAPWRNGKGPIKPTADQTPIVSVGCRNPNGTVSLFSNTGPWVRAYEQGAGVLSTMPPFEGSLQLEAETRAYGHVREQCDLIVSGGLGCSIMPVRFGVPPEIVLVTLGAKPTA